MQNDNFSQSNSSLDAWLFYLENLHNKPIDMGLERVNQVATYLNILKPAPFVFTVTGTNGKGTTCRMLETVLIAAGYKVGIYSSPHLMRYTERVRIKNTELPESLHIASFNVIENARGNISLTYFEFSTLSALWLFKQAQLDIVILEVGLGGRLDATNIVDSDVAVITNIALDHTDWLGMECEDISREKAGIFRAGKPAIIGELLDTSQKIIIQIAQEKDAYLLRYGTDWHFTVNKDSWDFEDTYGVISNLPLPFIPQLNAATAMAALRASGFKIKEQAIHEGIINATLPGRFQIINQSPRLIFDVAHNPHAAAYLSKQIKSILNTGNLLAIVGMLCDKDIAGTIACIETVVDYWYCASLEEHRGANAEQLMKHINQRSKAYASVTQAWYAAITEARPQDSILVFGSFNTVAHVMKILE